MTMCWRFGFASALLMVACGDGRSALAPAAINGAYILRTVNGTPLPVTVSLTAGVKRSTSLPGSSRSAMVDPSITASAGSGT